MSSPATYSRCCTNSTECPKNGLRCMPEMNPSTTWRARRSSREMRAMVSGCKNRRGSSSFLTAIKQTPTPLAAWQSHILRGRKGYCYAKPQAAIKSRCEELLEALVLGQLAFLRRRLLEHALDDVVGSDAFGGGGEVRQDTVPEHWVRQRLDVVGLHVRTAVEEGPRLAA